MRRNVLLEWNEMKFAQSCLTLCKPMDCSPPGSSVYGILQARILEGVAFPFSRESSQPRDRTQVSCIEANSLPAEPQGKPKNTRVGSLSLLQGIFPTRNRTGVFCIAGGFFTNCFCRASLQSTGSQRVGHNWVTFTSRSIFIIDLLVIKNSYMRP